MSNSYMIGTRQVPVWKVDIDYKESATWEQGDEGKFWCQHDGDTYEETAEDGLSSWKVQVCRECDKALVTY